MSHVLNITRKDFAPDWLVLNENAASTFLEGNYTHVKLNNDIYLCIVDYAPLRPKTESNKVVYLNAEVGLCGECGNALFVNTSHEGVNTLFECRSCMSE